MSARMSKIKNGGLDQYGAGPFERQQFVTAGIEGVKHDYHRLLFSTMSRVRPFKIVVIIFFRFVSISVRCRTRGAQARPGLSLRASFYSID